MAKTETTSFEKMGDGWMGHVVNASGQRSSYTTPVGRKSGGRSVQPSGTAAKRGSSMIHEANGPACTIKATLYKANAAEAGLQTRNVKLMKSATGSRDFRSSSSSY